MDPKKMSKKMFPMHGVVTDMQFTDVSIADLIQGKTTFILNGKELMFLTNRSEPPLTVPSHLVLAVKHTKIPSYLNFNGCLEVQACYIKDKGTFINDITIEEILFFLCFGLVGIFLWALWGPITDVGTILQITALFIICVLVMTCIEFRSPNTIEGRKVVNRRLHRINRLEEKRKLTPSTKPLE